MNQKGTYHGTNPHEIQHRADQGIGNYSPLRDLSIFW